MSEVKKKRASVESSSISSGASKRRDEGAPATKSSAPAVTASRKAINTDDLDPHTRKILKIRELMKLRDSARTNGEFGKSDSIRDHLVEKYNIDIIDQKDGPSGWKFKDGSSNKINSGAKLPPKGDSGESVPAKKRSREEEPTSTHVNQPKKRKDDQTQQATTSAKSKGKAVTAEQERNKALVANLAGSVSEGGRRVQGVLIEDLHIGTGKVCKIGDRIKMHYVGKLKSNGKVFDSSVNKPFVFRLGRGEVIGGWEIGCQGMAIGGRRRLTIPPEKAYGRAGAPPTIPGNATLVFEVSLVDIA